MKMRIIALLLLALLGLLVYLTQSQWRTMYDRYRGMETVESVRQKYEASVSARLSDALKSAGFSGFPDSLLLLAFKEEALLEVYGYREGWRLIKTYPFTASSGGLGPKLREGDRQIPEGIYQIGYLNPNSSYHLSLQINYPNESDRTRASAEGRTSPGKDIFIHGKQVSIGCIALGDPAIEEVFLLGAHAFPKGIRVIISPRDFRKNPQFPEIPSVSWAEQLYSQIREALEAV
jgi:murein L,D-transpeptidase YafK